MLFVSLPTRVTTRSMALALCDVSSLTNWRPGLGAPFSPATSGDGATIRVGVRDGQLEVTYEDKPSAGEAAA